MKRNKTQKIAALASVALLSLGLASCSSAAEEEPAALSADELTEITVGILPTVDLAPLMYAIDEGIFEKNGLAVETRVTSGGSEAIPALLAGDVDFIFSSYIPILLAQQSGLDVIIASGSHSNTPGLNTPSGIWTTGDSEIETMTDLKGKTISVNALGSVAELLVVESLEEVGLGKGDYELLEIPFPDVAGALDQNRVDAAWVAEPSRTTIQNDLGGKFVGSAEDPELMSVSETFADFPLAGYGARGDEDPAILKAFHDSMDESLKVLAEDPNIARELAPGYTTIPEELLSELTVSTFGPVTVEDIERLEDIMVRQGMLDAPLPDIKEIVYTP